MRRGSACIEPVTATVRAPRGRVTGAAGAVRISSCRSVSRSAARMSAAGRNRDRGSLSSATSTVCWRADGTVSDRGAGRQADGRPRVEDAGQAEVRNSRALALHKHVGRLQVAVDDAADMSRSASQTSPNEPRPRKHTRRYGPMGAPMANCPPPTTPRDPIRRSRACAGYARHGCDCCGVQVPCMRLETVGNQYTK